MLRYNQGFGKWGPMEQARFGEWVRYEDHAAEMEKRIVTYHSFILEEAYHDFQFARGVAISLAVALALQYWLS